MPCSCTQSDANARSAGLRTARFATAGSHDTSLLRTGSFIGAGGATLSDEGGWPSQMHWLDRHLLLALLGATALGVTLAIVIAKAR